MRKYLLFLFIAFLSFFCIDKVYAVSITSYDEHPGWISYKVDEGNSITNNNYRLLSFSGINYYMTDISRPSSPNQQPSSIMFQYYITPNSDTNRPYNIVFQIYAPGSRGVQVIVNNDVCQTSPASYYSNTNDPSSDRRFGPIYNIECQNRQSANPINITMFPQWHTNLISAGGTFSIGVSRMFFSDSLTTMNSQLRSIEETIRNSDSGIADKIDETNEKLDDVNQSVKDTNDTLNNDDTSEATDSAGDFFSGFTTNTHGLTGIITAPLTLIGNITSSSCSNLSVPLPFVNENITLPCMTSIYSRYFGSFYNIYKIITFGIVAYWVCVRVFALVKDFKNPEHDEIEVMDL